MFSVSEHYDSLNNRRTIVRGIAWPIDLEDLTAREVAAFVVTQSRQRPKSVKQMVTALRSLLGFLHAEGLIGQPLAVPSPAGWTQSGLPKALDGDQVAALLASCDPATRTGRRDLAILTLLARLGLRAGEVAALRLDDIDWRLGEITVRGKGNRHDRLPLPADAGQRIVAYLQDGRPGTAQGRTVFVRAQAPYRALTSNAVTTVVAYAGKRAGLGVIGAHRLRHSAATAMLRSGGSLTEIGQTLRHARDPGQSPALIRIPGPRRPGIQHRLQLGDLGRAELVLRAAGVLGGQRLPAARGQRPPPPVH